MRKPEPAPDCDPPRSRDLRSTRKWATAGATRSTAAATQADYASRAGALAPAGRDGRRGGGEEPRIGLGRPSAFARLRIGIVALETCRDALRIEEHSTDIA